MRWLLACLLFSGVGLAQPADPDDMEWEELPNPDDMEWEELPEPEDESGPSSSELEPVVDPPAADPDAPTEPEPEPTPEPDPEPTAEPATPPPSLQPPAPEPGAGPNWQRGGDSYYGGTLVGPIIGAGRRTVAFGVGVTHFIVPHVGIGADLVNVIRWGSPGIGTYYEFELTPIVTLLALPRRRFTPLIWGGFGFDVFSHKLGTYGRWVGGGGFAFTAGRLAIVTIGVEVDGRVPLSRWNANFTCGITRSNCSLGIRPVIGFSIPL